MRPENEARLLRIELISKVLRAVCKVFLVLCVLRFLILMTVTVVLSALQHHGFIWGRLQRGAVWPDCWWRNCNLCVLHVTVDGGISALLLPASSGWGNYSRGEISPRNR